MITMHVRALAIAAAVLALLAAPGPAAGIGAPDSLITKEVCAPNGYYTNGGDCAAVQSRLVANHSTALPTLIAGNPADPVMLFIHGWPDSAALWVNHFEAFCLNQTSGHYCVALTWTNHHPDFPEVTDPAKLWPDAVLQSMEDTADALALKDITLVIHDWGSMFGYQLAVKRPELIKRIVSFDIGNIGNPLPGFKSFCYSYQHANIGIYEGKSDAAARASAASFAPEAEFVTYRKSWIYKAMWVGGNADSECISAPELAWKARMFPAVDPHKWQYVVTPTFPADIPILFFWGGSSGGKPRPASTLFFGPDWGKHVNKSIEVPQSDHWIPVHGGLSCIAQMREWLEDMQR